MHLKALGIQEISKEYPAGTQKEFCRRCKNVNVYHTNPLSLLLIPIGRQFFKLQSDLAGQYL